MKPETLELLHYLRTMRRTLPKGTKLGLHIDRDHGGSPLFELRDLGLAFWQGEYTKVWQWGYETVYPGTRWDPPSSDFVDGDEEFDRLWQCILFLTKHYLTRHVDEMFVDAGMYLSFLEDERIVDEG